LIIAESALEIVPRGIASHPSVKKWAERRGKEPDKVLLDISFHYAAMRELKSWDRRGRPDIVFMTLLNVLGSPLNIDGKLQVYVHTINDFVITLDPEIKLPRNYLRFIGLVEQLFEIGKVPPTGKWLMKLEKKDLRTLLGELKPSKTIFFTEEGKKTKAERLGDLITREDNPAVVVGGFQKGEFNKENLKLADAVISLYKRTLDVWVVASIIVHEVGRALAMV